ncbi:ATP-binding protein [Sphingobium sp.]|uniref:hybrid sensor histidine kinase/response regulator n=1 Tax=Sphingobium sp. TaxID=1912891 RepID=UPI00262F131B|nr:ATP-binding protein [Sphingobium sp.]
MDRAAYVLREKRLYNKWVASQTLEDYALRYTADSARRWTAGQVANTAIGATAFLACEAIGASITLTYGFANSVAAIAAAVALMFVIGLPIAYHAAKHGLDIDLLTRGAGFGYLGSTLTSLIYASFTFLLFSVEATIMAVALKAMTGMPMSVAYLVSALVVIPIALYGMSAITRFQNATQAFWIVLQVAPIAYIFWSGPQALAQWSQFTGQLGAKDGSVSLLYFGFALSTLLSLLPQIGEQADYLRFLPAKAKIGRGRWWTAMLAGGPGWTLIGGMKLLLGSWLAHFLVKSAAAQSEASSPTAMFEGIYTAMSGHAGLSLILTGLFVIICQLKINVTNAYAGSIAWSNFFARLTHSHPGRVVWLIFNVLLALLLMEVGIFDAIEAILILYATVAAGWIGALAADLMISKPLRLSPAGIEFKRAHLFDINPVGIGAMLLSISVSGLAHFGLLGDIARAFAPVIGMAVAFTSAPIIALITHGRYYIARRSHWPAGSSTQTCIICENAFQHADMAHCPMYAAPICSLCCTLEARCHDRCKTDSRATQQAARWLERLLPRAVATHVHTPVGHFIAVMTIITLANGALMGGIGWQVARGAPSIAAQTSSLMLGLFLLFSLFGGVIAWMIVLAHQSRRTAMQESEHHVQKLMEEVIAHDVTGAELQRAKEAAEAANAAKSRYLVSVSHEIRSPLNSIYGYAQLMERGHEIAPVEAAKVIHRSAEHLTNLVEGLMDISQVESGVLRISSETVRLSPFVDQIANMFRPQAQAKGIEFLYERPEKLPDFVRTDQKRLRQILINLLSNAIKFTRSGSVTFRVAYRSQMATFDIIDTGIGIAPDDLKRIFDPFERGSNPDAQRQKGIGLGLAITQALAQILGGDLSVVSQPDRGTQFTMRLMLGHVASQTADNEPVERVRGYEGQRRKVLLIDDDASQVAVLRGLLEPLDFAVLEALSGRAGLEIAVREQPDIVLLDISMPGESGWDVCRALRETLGGAVRIIMVSANAHEYHRGGDGRAAHDMFLMKPVDLDALLDAIADQLHIRWTGDAPPTPPVTSEDDVLTPLPEEAVPILADIEQKAIIGHVRGIEASIRALEQAVPTAQPLARRLLAHLDRFDLKGLIRTIRAAR